MANRAAEVQAQNPGVSQDNAFIVAMSERVATAVVNTIASWFTSAPVASPNNTRNQNPVTSTGPQNTGNQTPIKDYGTSTTTPGTPLQTDTNTGGVQIPNPDTGVTVGGGFGGGTQPVVNPIVLSVDPSSLNSPATRHYADKVTQTSVAKDVNTVIDRSVVDISADVSAIRSGQGQNIGDTFIVNGRTYGMHDGALYPMSGPGLYTLDRGGYKALGVLNKFWDTPQAEIILKNMGVSTATKAAALEVFKVIKK